MTLRSRLCHFLPPSILSRLFGVRKRRGILDMANISVALACLGMAVLICLLSPLPPGSKSFPIDYFILLFFYLTPRRAFLNLGVFLVLIQVFSPLYLFYGALRQFLFPFDLVDSIRGKTRQRSGSAAPYCPIRPERAPSLHFSPSMTVKIPTD